MLHPRGDPAPERRWGGLREGGLPGHRLPPSRALTTPLCLVGTPSKDSSLHPHPACPEAPSTPGAHMVPLPGGTDRPQEPWPELGPPVPLAATCSLASWPRAGHWDLAQGELRGRATSPSDRKWGDRWAAERQRWGHAPPWRSVRDPRASLAADPRHSNPATWQEPPSCQGNWGPEAQLTVATKGRKQGGAGSAEWAPGKLGRDHGKVS